jgi:hypothetical protein
MSCLEEAGSQCPKAEDLHRAIRTEAVACLVAVPTRAVDFLCRLDRAEYLAQELNQLAGLLGYRLEVALCQGQGKLRPLMEATGFDRL